MSSCPTCGNRGYLCQQCKMEELEDRHGRPSDNFNEDTDGVRCWVQAIDETWHASMYFEDTRHVAACGEILETPVAGVKDDPRFVDETRTCEDCEAYLEGDDEETVPDGGEFETASELRADGGEVDVYQWVLENVHEYPAGTDSRWGSRGNLVHQGRKLDGVTKEDVQVAIARAVDNEDLLSWHGLLARAEIDRLREITRIEHEEHDITRGILVGKCNKLIATKKQEQADENAEREVATDGGLQPYAERVEVEGGHEVRCTVCGNQAPTVAGIDHDCIYQNDLVADGGLEEVFRRETITEAGDGGLLVGEREVVDAIDDVCSELEALREQVDNPDAQAALRSAIGNVWRASVIQRLDENSDIRMVADTGRGSTSVRGPVADDFTRERGESR